MKCPICNTKIVEGDTFCTNCGAKIEKKETRGTKANSSKLIVVLIGILVLASLVGGVIFFIGNGKDDKNDGKETTVKEEIIEEQEEQEIEESEIEEGAPVVVAEPEVLTDVWAEPLYVMVNASSQLSNEPGIHYNVSNLCDDEPASCWSEGVSGYGEGETITFMTKSGAQTARGIAILPGLLKSKKLFYNNGCPEKISVLVDGEKHYSFSLDSFIPDFEYPLTSMLYCDFGEEIEFQYIIVTIESVREGNKFKDTCISEMYPYR